MEYLSEETKEMLQKVDFVKNYADILNKYDCYDSTLEKYDKNTVVEVINNLGYKDCKFLLREKLFTIEKIEVKDKMVSLFIDLKYGLVDFGMQFSNPDNNIEFISGFRINYRVLVGVPDGQFSSPAFKSYSDLSDILRKCFIIYEDIKKELFKL